MINNKVSNIQLIYREELNEFQGDLKLPNQDEISLLKSRIVNKGFSTPLFVREAENTMYILDWHQRLKALDLLADEWFMLEDDKVPCVVIKADNEADAKALVLEYNSKYSEFDEIQLKEFAMNLDVEDINLYTQWVQLELSFEPIKIWSTETLKEHRDFSSKNEEIDVDDLIEDGCTCPKCGFEFEC